MKNQKRWFIGFGALLVVSIIYYCSPPVNSPIVDGFEGWEKFGINETYNVGSFIPIVGSNLKSPVVTSEFLKNRSSNINKLLRLSNVSTFDSKRVDYTSKFNSTIGIDVVSQEFKSSLSGLQKVNYDVFGGKQKRLAGGTIVLSEVVRNLPDETIEDMKRAFDRHDSIIFITEVMEYDSARFSMNWNKELSPNVKTNIEGGLKTFGGDGKWTKDKTYQISSTIPKNFLFKYEPVNESLKELIFRRNRVLLAKRAALIPRVSILKPPIQVADWNSGRINGKSWRFENVNAVLESNGVLKISGKQSSNRWQGFSAGINVVLKDKNGKKIKTLRTKESGVSGKSRRDFSQTIILDGKTAEKVAEIDLQVVN